MKFFVCFIAVSFYAKCWAQSRKELQLEIRNYLRDAVMNQSYDVSKTALFEAVYVMMKKEYSEIREKDLEKGIITGYAENDSNRETLRVKLWDQVLTKLSLH